MTDSTPKVYLSQPQMRTDRSMGTRSPLINPSAFRDYGRPVYLLEDAQWLDGDLMWTEINRRLTETDYNPHTDYFIVSGDVTIACFAFHAMQRRGGARLLRWDRDSKSYDVIEIPVEVAIEEFAEDGVRP